MRCLRTFRGEVGPFHPKFLDSFCPPGGRQDHPKDLVVLPLASDSGQMSHGLWCALLHIEMVSSAYLPAGLRTSIQVSRICW
jgi:hypothetical protein